MLHVAWLLTMKPFGEQKLTPREKSGPRRRLRRKWDSISREACFFPIYTLQKTHMRMENQTFEDVHSGNLT